MLIGGDLGEHGEEGNVIERGLIAANGLGQMRERHACRGGGR